MVENSSEVGIVVVGTGMMGTDHLQRIPRSIAGARVVTVVDADPARAERAVELAPGARTAASLTEALDHGDVGGVLIATPGSTHYPLVMEALEARIPILCEKPLTEDAASSWEILEAEMGGGERLIQVGFMRRFDRHHLEAKSVIAEGELGDPLIGRFVHRLDVAAPGFPEGFLIPESTVHEFDTARWFFDDEIRSIRVLKPRHNGFAKEGLKGPQLIVVTMNSGAISFVESNLDCAYGYEVSGEITLERGTVEYGRPSGASSRRDGQIASPVTQNYRERFAGAYTGEIQAWVDGIRAGDISGPSAWDGYAATVAVEAGVRAQATGEEVPVFLPERPEFYA
ncbi:MAG: Gfo/Idh/MocA family protein [Leucobacter sp.]